MGRRHARDPAPRVARSDCPTGKSGMSHAEAAGAAHRIRRRDRARNANDNAVREYLCPDCGWWHVGHRPALAPNPRRTLDPQATTADGYERLGLPPPE